MNNSSNSLNLLSTFVDFTRCHNTGDEEVKSSRNYMRHCSVTGCCHLWNIHFCKTTTPWWDKVNCNNHSPSSSYLPTTNTAWNILSTSTTSLLAVPSRTSQSNISLSKNHSDITLSRYTTYNNSSSKESIWIFCWSRTWFFCI